MKRILLVAVVLVTLVAQLGVIGCFAYRNERLLREGVECRFACQAYDPHDPFRGKYLRVSVTAEFTDISYGKRTSAPCRIGGSGLIRRAGGADFRVSSPVRMSRVVLASGRG